MSDDADEIAREIAWQTAVTIDATDIDAALAERKGLAEAIAAALRACGVEQVQEFRMRVMHGDTGSTNTTVTSGPGGTGMLPESQP